MKRIFGALTIVFLITTILLAWAKVHERGALRDAGTAGLPAVQDAVEQRFGEGVTAAAEALRAWDGRGPAPDLLTRAEEVQASQPPEAVDLGDGVAVVVEPAAVEVIVQGADDRSFRRGTMDRARLIARLEADARVGLPASAALEREGRFSNIELVDGATGRVLFSHHAADDDKASGGSPDIAALLSGGTDSTLARKQIARGMGGEGIAYKGADGDSAVGTWRPLQALPGVWVLAEIREIDATFPTRGYPLELMDQTLGEIQVWHVTLGLGVLLLLATTFLSLQKRNMRYGVLIRVFAFVRPYAWGAVSVILLGLFYALLNIVAKVLLIRKLVDDVLVNPGPDAIPTLWWIAAAMGVTAFLMAGAAFLKTYLRNMYSATIMADIRLAIGKKIVSLPLSFFQRYRGGDLIARIERDAGSMKRVFNQAFKTASVDPFELVGAVVTAFVVNARLALVLLGLPLIVFPLFRIAKRIKKRAEKRQVLLADISHVLFQMLVGIKVIKAFGGEDREASRLDTANRRFLGSVRRIFKLSALSESLLDLLQMLGAAIIFVGGGYLVIGGGVSVGDVTAFMVIIQRAYTSSKRLTNTANQIVNALPGTERVFEILDAPNTLPDGPREMPKGGLREGITFDHVTFAYGEKPILRDISLHIPAGKIVAVVGPTGAGKTTLCDLVARFYDPTSGAVLCDGVDVREYTVRSLVGNVAIVTQDAFLFNATVFENIEYGKPGATRDEIREAAANAFVHDEIKSMEGGYQKLCGERGSAVSGGQRQRITIARAILKDAPVLILDEATSALDTHAEQQVQSALDRLMSGRTVVVVAHRLSTIRNADMVVVMREGKIVETGAPQDLLGNPKSQFKRMYDLQMGSGRQGDAGDPS